LPKGAALYASVKLEMLDRTAGSLPEIERSSKRLSKALGGSSLSAALASLGVAGDRPILIAILPGSAARSRKAVEKAKILPVIPPGTEAGLGSGMRVILPLSPGADASRFVEPLKSMVSEPVVDNCPGAASCERIGGEGLVAVIRGLSAGYTLRKRGDALEIDQYAALVEDGTHPSALLAMKALAASPLGGPEAPHCSRFDPSALASLCIDPDRMAELGVVQGLGIGLGAIAVDPVEPSSAEITQEQRLRLLEQSALEANRNEELAHPARRLLDDGTLVVTRSGGRERSTASFALTPASSASISQAFAAPVCAEGPAFVGEVLPKLLDAFGDPGPDFADPKAVVEHIKEAGWSALPIVLGRIWPNVLAKQGKEYRDKLELMLSGTKVCAKVKDGRLEIESEGAATH